MVGLQNFGFFLILIGIMILIHELGHYWAAIWFGVRAEVFSFGFGPRLFGFKIGETDFRFSAIPFGGYVRMTGQSDTEVTQASDDPRSFLNKPRWQRLIIAFAGPAMNVILAFALLTGVFMVRFPKLAGAEGPAVVGYVAAGSPAEQAGVREGDVITRIEDQSRPTWEDVVMKEIVSAGKPLALIVERNRATERLVLTPRLDPKTNVGDAGWANNHEPQVADVSPEMGAARAGLQKGDVILAANGTPLFSTERLQEIVGASAGKAIEILYSRNRERHKVSVEPAFNKDIGKNGRWMIGVALVPSVVITKLPFGEAVRESVKQNARSAGMIYEFLRGIVEQRMSPKSLEGPIRIAQISGEAARRGWAEYVGLMAMVSLNLAIFNLLPIPILDGGMILMLLIEMMVGRDLSLRVKETVLKFGFVFLMAMIVFVLYNDISKVAVG